MIVILFWVLMVLWVIHGPPWPGSPWAGWPLGSAIIPFLLFLCLGIAVFGFGLNARL